MVKDLIYASPESQGISSQDVLKFIDEIEKHKINLHSFMFVRNGKILAEGYFKHFDKDFKHRLYSSTKTFLAVAIGVLIDQGVLTLKTKVVKFLKPLIHTKLCKEVKDMTVEDCLTMSHPMYGGKGPNLDYRLWNEGYINSPDIIKPSGACFQYGAGANLLGVVVEMATGGKTFVDVLRPIFDELGMSKDIRCVQDYQGYCWGGSGLVCTLRDYAKFGEFVMNRGKVNGKQLVSLSYMKKMTSQQYSAVQSNNYSPLKHGYGYFTWITPDGIAFRGLGTQDCFCFKNKDFMFCCQAETCGPNDVADLTVYDLVKLLVYDKIGRVRKEGKAYEKLQAKLKNLKSPSYGTASSKFEKVIDGKTYTLGNNAMKWSWFKFDFTSTGGTLSYENARGVKTIKFGKGELIKATFPETGYYDWKAHVPANRELNSLNCVEWIDENTLLLRAHIADIPFGSMYTRFAFKGDKVGVANSAVGEFLFYDYNGFAYGELKK